MRTRGLASQAGAAANSEEREAEQPWRRQSGKPHRRHEIAAVHRSTTTATIGWKMVLVTHRQVSCRGVGGTELEGCSTNGGTRRTTPVNLAETAGQCKLLAVRGPSNRSAANAIHEGHAEHEEPTAGRGNFAPSIIHCLALIRIFLFWFFFVFSVLFVDRSFPWRCSSIFVPFSSLAG